MQPGSEPAQGLIHALLLDGRGGAKSLDLAALLSVRPGPEESLWVHWDRGAAESRQWLYERSGLSEFACDLLLEENTRPRLLPLPDEALLLFLRGVNLNPDAEPEDMVSLRIHAEAKRVVSLRLRPLRAAQHVAQLLREGRGPKTASEVLVFLADSLTERINDLVAQLGERIDKDEECLELDAHYEPSSTLTLSLRRTAASLRRYLLPQREIYDQLTRRNVSWFLPDDTDYWNELNNRLVRFLEELDLVRERANLLLEADQRRRGERMNRTMYLLGIITGFFLPMTFLTGLLGINVGGIPGADNPSGFLLACLILGLIGVLQWWIFRRLRWL